MRILDMDDGWLSSLLLPVLDVCLSAYLKWSLIESFPELLVKLFKWQHKSNLFPRKLWHLWTLQGIVHHKYWVLLTLAALSQEYPIKNILGINYLLLSIAFILLCGGSADKGLYLPPTTPSGTLPGKGENQLLLYRVPPKCFQRQIHSHMLNKK